MHTLVLKAGSPLIEQNAYFLRCEKCSNSNSLTIIFRIRACVVSKCSQLCWLSEKNKLKLKWHNNHEIGYYGNFSNYSLNCLKIMQTCHFQPWKSKISRKIFELFFESPSRNYEHLQKNSYTILASPFKFFAISVCVSWTKNAIFTCFVKSHVHVCKWRPFLHKMSNSFESLYCIFHVTYKS